MIKIPPVFLLLFAFAFFHPISSALAGSSALPPHPRLLAKAKDFERIREGIRRPGPLADAFAVLQSAGEREFTEPPVKREMVGVHMLPTTRAAVRRVFSFSLLYRLTLEPRWAKRAEQEMMALAAFSDWNPAQFLNVAEAATAMAIGYDWTYDTLTPDSRRILREAIVKHALVPGDDDAIGWRRQRNNWIQVCEGGLALAALAVAGDEPGEPLAGLCKRAVERARRNVPKLAESYQPDGAYAEGPMYWGYGTMYQVLLAEALRSATGSCGDLVKDPSFLKSASVIEILTGPDGSFFNYGDCTRTRRFSPLSYWFARETGDAALACRENAELERMIKKPSADFPGVYFSLILLWVTDAPIKEAMLSLPEAWASRGPSPLAVFRRGEGKDSLYAAIKGGRGRNNHAHMDMGSFILDLAGVRWAVDPGAQSYNGLRKAGVNLFGKDRWKVYMYSPYIHSVPLIDDAFPDDQASATLFRFSKEKSSATMDLTAPYARQAKRLHRTLQVVSPTSLRIRDEIDGVAPGARYRFSWMTHAVVKTDSNTILLRQNKRTLRLTIKTDAPFELFNEDASIPPQPYDTPPKGLRRVGVLLTIQKPKHVLEVQVSLEKGIPE